MNVLRLVGVVSVGLIGCQTYDFERVVPFTVGQTNDTYEITAKRLKPNVMLLVDNSGSMLAPTNAQNATCPPGCGSTSNQCPASCPTRISEMKSAMATFLQASGTIARFGLTIYPVPGDVSLQCKGSTRVEVSLPAPAITDDGSDTVLQGNANEVNARIQSLVPSGGTPTGASLEFVGTSAGLNDANDGREDFVLLLTDGLPNCNTANANQLCGCGSSCSAAQVNACSCTTGGGCSSGTCALGCLDRDATVETVKALANEGIKTIVVGFGADLASGNGPAVLNAMAREGGFPRSCPMLTDAECGGAQGSCNTFTGQCSTSFYQAATGVELAAALEEIGGKIPEDACTFLLSERPSDPQYLAVILDGETLLPGPETFEYFHDAQRVEFRGATCRRIESSTPQNPLSLVFRIVQRF